MKGKIISKSGKKEIKVPEIFSGNVREDIALKYFQIVREGQKYGNSPKAGKEFSDKVRHAKRKFRGHYGRGISRIPRKVFWRRGTQFYWEGAGVSGAVGGRRAHPPKPLTKTKKMNKKEMEKAIISALTSTVKKDWLKKRYSTVNEVDTELPIIIDGKILKLNTKEFHSFLEKILKNLYKVGVQKKKVRAGKGKRRGRKYKKSAGLLLVIGNKEEKKVNRIDVKKVGELGIEDFWPLGRLTIYTENAIKDLEKMWGKEE